MSANLNKLRDLILSYKKAAVALSGGLDSSVLLAFCVQTLGRENCAAFTISTPYMMRSEICDAKKLCDKLNLDLHLAELEKIPPQIEFNPPDRCYICKYILFKSISKKAETLGFDTLIDGTNYDDLSDYRPGMRALSELGIKSPFLECEIGKSDIRKLAESMGLDFSDKPAYACLLTRLEHGRKIDTASLKKIDELESFLRQNYTRKVRARLESENIRIECDSSDFIKIASAAREISDFAKKLGFKHCSLDLGGYKQGSMNLKNA